MNTIPPALRGAVRDGVITPATATGLAPYLTLPTGSPRIDRAASTIGKVISMATFTAIALTIIAALLALAAALIRTVVGS